MHPIFIAGPCVIESWELLETVGFRDWLKSISTWVQRLSSKRRSTRQIERLYTHFEVPVSKKDCKCWNR